MSKKKMIFYANPKGGRFDFEKPLSFKNAPGKLNGYGRIKITIEKYVPMKSNKQMGYYRGGILPWLEAEFIEDTGLNRNGWHELLKQQCGIIIEFVDKVSYPKSLADYTEKEMALYITKVGQWVMEWLQATIPPPTVIESYL